MTKRRKAVMTECQTCGTHFPAHQCKLEQGFRKYCSPACRHESNGFRRMVLAALPSTPSKLCAKFNLPNKTIQRILRRGMDNGDCHMVKMVRIEGTPPRNTSPYEMHFKPGPKPIVSILPDNFKEAHRLLILHVILGAMPDIQSEIRKTTGLSQASVCVGIQELRKQHRCYITTLAQERNWRCCCGIPTWSLQGCHLSHQELHQERDLRPLPEEAEEERLARRLPSPRRQPTGNPHQAQDWRPIH